MGGCLRSLLRNIIWVKRQQVEYWRLEAEEKNKKVECLRLAVEEKQLMMKLRDMEEGKKKPEAKKEEAMQEDKKEQNKEMKRLEDMVVVT